MRGDIRVLTPSSRANRYAVDVREKRLKPGPWSQADVGPRCMTLMAVPGDGLAAVAIGEVSVAYYKSGESKVCCLSYAAVSLVSVHLSLEVSRCLSCYTSISCAMLFFCTVIPFATQLLLALDSTRLLRCYLLCCTLRTYRILDDC